MTALSVNLNAVAFLRNRRDVGWPSVVEMGRLALNAGAAGITVHPRPDERHIRRSDLAPLKVLVAEFDGAEFNIEGYPDPAFLDLVLEYAPHQVTFVPDDPAQASARIVATTPGEAGVVQVYFDPVSLPPGQPAERVFRVDHEAKVTAV